MNKSIKNLIGLGITMSLGIVTYFNVDAFFDIHLARGELIDVVKLLDNYVNSGIDQYLTNAISTIKESQTLIMSHWNIFPLGTNASELSNVVNDLSKENPNINQSIETIKEVAKSYVGPGNCPYRMIIPGILTAYSGYKTSLGFTNKN